MQKNIHLFFFLLFSLFSIAYGAESDHYTIIKDENPVHILTPSIAKRETVKIRLSNGLEALLISDPGLDKSGAGIAVEAGSWQNPKKHLGMAHFLEHLLFLGTKKYPDEAGYARFLDEHGGMRNAFTENDRTVYMFSVNNDSFAEALDQFSRFFIDPLFNPSGVARESHAIDQEYAKNLQNDNWRLYHVRKALENPLHPDSDFSIGNLNTISKISPDVVRQWYEDHYSANLMHLVIYSTLPMDKLKELVVTDFSPIKNKHFTPPNIEETLFTDKYKENIIYIVPYQNIRELVLQWEISDKYQYDAKTVAYVLGYEDSNSLLELLKNEGLAEELSTGSSLQRPRILFTLDIALTDKGVQEVDRVIKYCYEAIARLKKENIPQALYNEMKQLATIAYEYQSREDVFSAVMSDAEKMVDEPIATYPLKTVIPTKYDPKDIQDLLNQLTPENCLYFVLAKQELTHVVPTTKEPWMQAEYAIVPIKKSTLLDWKNAEPNPKITLPPINPFVPEHLSLIETPTEIHSSVLAKPELILMDEHSKLYYAEDMRYLIPKVAASFRIHTAAKKPGNAKLAALTDLYLKALDYMLSPISYQGLLADLHFSTQPIEDGLSISIYGYSEKASLFFKEMLKSLKSLNLSEEDFLILKDSLQKEYANTSLDPPLQQSQEILKSILYENFITDEKRALALANVSREDMIKFVNTLYAKTYTECLIYGNINKDDALALNQDLQSILSSTPLPTGSIAKRKVLQLNPENGPYSYTKEIEQYGNATLLLIQDGCYSLKKRSALQILSKGLEAPFFDELRTKQQTGYLVNSFNQEIERELCALFFVQSNTHDTVSLLSRFELFFENNLKNFTSTAFSEERFQTIRDAQVIELSKSPKSLLEMTAKLEVLAFDYDGNFNFLEDRIQSLRELSYDEFTSFAKEFLGRSNHRRLGILVNGILPKENDLRYTNVSFKRLRKSGTYFTAEENLCPK
ncbi:MAG: insulinase family protein [Chlamydiales bacterium]|nr:insulinase family protein [Chlamydiales bacterium]